MAAFATTLELAGTAVGTLGGAREGTWAYDESSNTLTVNDTQLIVDRAWDWEASPRVTTITYAGLSPSGRSFWGKRVSGD